MARSERQEAGTRNGVGTLTQPGTRPRPQQAGEAGQGAPEPRRGRPSRPVPAQRAAVQRPAGEQRASAGRGAGGQRGAPQAAALSPRPGLRRRAVVPPQAAPAERGAAPQRGRATGPKPAAAPAQSAQPLQAQPQAAPPGKTAAHSGSRRMPFVVLLCGLLGGALVSALVISTTLAEGSFEISNLQASTSTLAKQQQALEAEVAQAQAPQQIAERASQLGMRRVGELRFIDLTTGKVTNDGPTPSGAASAPGYAP